MNGYGKVRYFGEIGVDMRGRQMDELIRKKDALDALMTERKRLLANGQKGAEHILTHHGYNVIAELNVPDTNVGDMISRQAALDALHTWFRDGFEEDKWWNSTHVLAALECVPSAQPEIKPISYEDCANAMLKMWMDNVLTDGEYNRIMNKLNKFEAERRTDE